MPCALVVARDGTVYEGRGLSVMGAHAGSTREADRAAVLAKRAGDDEALRAARRLDPDHGAIGVVVDGHFADEPPPPAQREALVALIARLRRAYDVRAEDVITHREVRRRLVEARGLAPSSPATTCPGDALHAFVLSLRADP